AHRSKDCDREIAMIQALEFVTSNWFSILLLAIGIGLAVALLVAYGRWRNLSLPLLVSAAVCALLALGGLILPFDIALWGGAAAAAILFGMLLVEIGSAHV